VWIPPRFPFAKTRWRSNPRDRPLLSLVLSTGSTDGTDAIAGAMAIAVVALERIEPLRRQPRRYLGAALSPRDILLLCEREHDVDRTRCAGWSRHFRRPAVGAVSGDVRLRSTHVA